MKTKVRVKFFNGKKGTALAYALVITFAVSIILVSMVGYITSQLKFSFNRVQKQQAFQVAEAGIYYYKWYLAHNTEGKTPAEIATFWETGGSLGFAPAEANYEDIGKYRLVIDHPAPGSTAVTVRSTGWTNKNPNLKRTIQVRFRLPSWSEYALMINAPIHLGNDVVINGKIHSNGGIWFDGRATNTVSALPASFDDPNKGGTGPDFGVHTSGDPDAPAYPWPDGTVPEWPKIFEGGREFPVSEVSFGGITLDLASMKNISGSGDNLYFGNDGEGKWIVLKGETFDVCTVDTYHAVNYTVSKFKKKETSGTCDSCSGECVSSYTIPQNGVIFVENNVWIEGNTSNKKVSVVAANLLGGEPADVFIGINSSGDIRLGSFDCNNKLGIVAQRDVMITKNSPTDLTVDAALIAQTGKIGISQNFTSAQSVTFNGAVASLLEPFFMHGQNGFSVRVFNYDSSLIYCPPPNFPTGTLYSIDLWEEL